MKDVKNDTAGHGYCGPTILAAITGKPLSTVLDTIREVRAAYGRRVTDDRGRKINVAGTTAHDVRKAFDKFGWTMGKVSNFGYPVKYRPTVAAWLKKRAPSERKLTYVLVIGERPGSPGSSWEGGHWVAVTGRKFADTYTKGKWVWIKEAPHRRKRVKEVWLVNNGDNRPAAGAQGPALLASMVPRIGR